MKVAFSPEGRILVDGQPCGNPTSVRNIDLLRYMLVRRTVVSIGDMVAYVYPREDSDTEFQFEGVRIALTKLRKALGPHRRMIQNRYGEGYFCHPDYTYDKDQEKTIVVTVPEDLVSRVAMFYDCNADQVVSKLLMREIKRNEL